VQFSLHFLAPESGSGIRIPNPGSEFRIRIHKVFECGSISDPDPEPWKKNIGVDSKVQVPVHRLSIALYATQKIYEMSQTSVS
jgi:hypothetical protein